MKTLKPPILNRIGGQKYKEKHTIKIDGVLTGGP